MSESENPDGLSGVIARCSCLILVLGGIGSGKTTLINTLLGEEILPSSISSLTAAVAKVSYAQKKKVLVYPWEDGGSPVKPFTVRPEASQIRTILQQGCLPVSADNKTAFRVKKIEIFWPSAFLKNGIVVIDTPGYYDARNRTYIFREYLCKADLALYCINGTAGYSVNDKNILQQINAMWVRPPVIVTTFFDCVTAGRSAYEVREYMDACHSKYGNHTKKECCFFVDSRLGLQAKRKSDHPTLVQSGYDGLERFLTEYLAKKFWERLSVEHIRFSEEKDRELQEAQTALEEARRHGELVKDRFRAGTGSLQSVIENRLVPYGRSLSQNMNLDDYQPAVAFEWFEPVRSCGQMGEDCGRELLRRVRQDIQNWENRMLWPGIREALKILFSDMKEELERFDAAMQRIGGSHHTKMFAQALQSKGVIAQGNMSLADKLYLLLFDFVDLAERAGAAVGAQSGFLAYAPSVQKRIKKRIVGELREYMDAKKVIRRIAQPDTGPLDHLETDLCQAIQKDIEAAEERIQFLNRARVEEEQKIIRYTEEQVHAVKETERVSVPAGRTHGGQEPGNRAGLLAQGSGVLRSSFAQALRRTIRLCGTEVLKDRQKLIAHLSDLAPADRKEIRIFAKSCSPALLEMFLANISDSSRTQAMEKARLFLQEEEGLSPDWAECVAGSLGYALGWKEEKTPRHGPSVF